MKIIDTYKTKGDSIEILELIKSVWNVHFLV